MFARWMGALLGGWLIFVSGLALNADTRVRLNELIVGVAVVAVAFLGVKRRGLRRINTALGAWLVVAPYVLRYERPLSVVNDIVVGMCVIAVSLIPTVPRRSPLDAPVLGPPPPRKV